MRKGVMEPEGSKEFSVYQFFEGGSYECVRQYVDAENASKAAQHYCTSVGAQMGFTQRVIITDGGDTICFEWVYGKGIVFPNKETKND
jgi:hypothetical protein